MLVEFDCTKEDKIKISKITGDTVQKDNIDAITLQLQSMGFDCYNTEDTFTVFRKSKLFDILGIPRWGVEYEDRIEVDETYYNNTWYQAYTTGKHHKVLHSGSNLTKEEYEEICRINGLVP